GITRSPLGIWTITRSRPSTMRLRMSSTSMPTMRSKYRTTAWSLTRTLGCLAMAPPSLVVASMDAVGQLVAPHLHAAGVGRAAQRQHVNLAPRPAGVVGRPAIDPVVDRHRAAGLHDLGRGGVERVHVIPRVNGDLH